MTRGADGSPQRDADEPDNERGNTTSGAFKGALDRVDEPHPMRGDE